ncbi:MAG: asparagine synthase-related protein [Nitrosopumilus sp.]|nr:asparagine synthase-related protein [Nitrosopumilus sp.]
MVDARAHPAWDWDLGSGDPPLAGPLLGAARDAVSCASPGVAVAFSGGVDSALLAVLCRDAGLRPVLVTVGFPGSRDMRAAEGAGRLLGCPHVFGRITPGSLAEAARGAGDPTTVYSRAAFAHVARAASGAGAGEIITANGIDELFCGYDAFRREHHLGGAHLERMMASRLGRERAMLAAACGALDVPALHPFMSARFEERAMQVPVHEKITGGDDAYRKHPARYVAMRAGVPRTYYTRLKIALQYGTRISAELRRGRGAPSGTPTWQGRGPRQGAPPA